jgi:Arc/MetJ-type ribon-helix-helix transcriptional regulator
LRWIWIESKYGSKSEVIREGIHDGRALPAEDVFAELMTGHEAMAKKAVA